MKSLFISGIIMFAGSLILIYANYDEIKVDKYGKVVKMKIENLPYSCIGSKIRYYVTYSYENKLYEKATRGNFCQEHKIGELINMKFLDGYKTILRPNESAILNLLAFLAVGLIGIGISILQWRKINQIQ